MSGTVAAAHDRHARYWAVALALLCATGLSTNWIDLGPLWKGYALDVTGPAWNYILFRGRFTSWADNAWTRFFTPKRTFLVFVIVCFGIEGAQYLSLYDSTFDPWDLVAYVVLLLPVFVVDLATKPGSATEGGSPGVTREAL